VCVRFVVDRNKGTTEQDDEEKKLHFSALVFRIPHDMRNETLNWRAKWISSEN